MNLHHDALVLVADGQKYLILRNDGDVRAPRLVVEGGAERAGQPARAFGDDRPGRTEARAAREAAWRFLHAMAGDLPGFEEACRVLFAGDRDAFRARTAAWPADVRAHGETMAWPAA